MTNIADHSILCLRKLLVNPLRKIDKRATLSDVEDADSRSHVCSKPIAQLHSYQRVYSRVRQWSLGVDVVDGYSKYFGCTLRQDLDQIPCPDSLELFNSRSLREAPHEAVEFPNCSGWPGSHATANLGSWRQERPYGIAHGLIPVTICPCFGCVMAISNYSKSSGMAWAR